MIEAQDINLTLVKEATFSSQAIFKTTADLTIGEEVIPKGSLTDGATMPRWLELLAVVGTLTIALIYIDGFIGTSVFLIFWLILFFKYMIPPFGKYVLAVALHDELLKRPDVTRKQADRGMKEALKFLNVNSFLQFWMYRLVRLQSLIKSKVVD